MSPATKRLRIRLWWSLYSRDRLIALALRRPTQINEGACDVPLPRLSDFDIRPFHPAVFQMLRYQQLDDVSYQRRLATMFIEKVKLCQYLGRVLFAQYSPSNHNFGATNKTTITLVPREASEAELDRCSQKLDAWVSGLPKDAQFIPPKSQHLSEGEKVLLLHSAMLRMIYHATCSALHRPQALIFGRKAHSTSKKAKWSITARQKMQDAAAGTTEIAHGLNRLGLTKFLPASGLTVVLPAAVVHLTNLTSSNPVVRDESTWNFHRCVEVLNKLKDIYPAADHETAYLEEAVRWQLKRSPNSVLIMQNATFSVVGGDRTQPDNGARSLTDRAVNDWTTSAQTKESTPARTNMRNNNQFQGSIIELDEEDRDRNTTLHSTDFRDQNAGRFNNTTMMTFTNNNTCSISDHSSSSYQLHNIQIQSNNDSTPTNTFPDRNSPKEQPEEWDWNVDVLNDWLVSSDEDGDGDGDGEGENENEGQSQSKHERQTQIENKDADHTTKNMRHDAENLSKEKAEAEADIVSSSSSSSPPLLLHTEQEDQHQHQDQQQQLLVSPSLLFPPSVISSDNSSSSSRDSMMITGDLERDLGFA